jgi:hypothetical protein
MEMPGWLDLLGRLMDRTGSLMRRLGNLESSAHRDILDEITIVRPIYIAGLARSGSTILLEMLARHPDAATHRYRDLPPVMTPIFWNKAFGQIYDKEVAPVERAHKDRIMVTPDSPEALEEILWMAFFESCHDPEKVNILDSSTSNPAFEDFYRDHLRKILHVRSGRRYLSKGNYNITRIGYLQKLFPDARFIVPIRDPTWHVASLMKQHQLFCREEERDPRILRHMQRIGHFEFGLDRRAINTGDGERSRSIAALWQGGEEVRGWARLWASLYGFLDAQRAQDEILRRQILIVRYEDLCNMPGETLAKVFDHAGLELSPTLDATLTGELSQPNYYRPSFTADEERVIREETEETAVLLGYEI